jgi:hypothetical protein
VNLEQQIRSLVERGCNKSEVAHVIGVHPKKIPLICEHIPGLVWKRKPRRKRAKQSVPYLEANLVKARAARKAGLAQTVRGVTGTVRDLCTHFKTAVSYSTVNRRVAAGMSLEDAMFSAPGVNNKPAPRKTKAKKRPWVKYGYVRGAAGLAVEQRA